MSIAVALWRSMAEGAGSFGQKGTTMRKHLVWSVVAVAAALVTLVFAAYAADPNAAPPSPSTAGATQPVAGTGAAPRWPGPGDSLRPDTGELPQILMVAAVNLRAKNDPEVQMLLDKAIADMQVIQQDEAARLLAFQQLVQAERGGDADAVRKARDGVNSVNVKLVTDARQFNQQDMGPLRKRLRELIARGPTPETGGPATVSSAATSGK